jgi:hypothetical protein
VLACKCLHRRRASDRAFLRLFQARQPTHLLDFFIIGHCIPHPVFVSMPTLRHPDKALVSVLVRTFKIVPDSEGVWVRGDRPAPVPWLRCHGRDRDPPPARRCSSMRTVKTPRAIARTSTITMTAGAAPCMSLPDSSMSPGPCAHAYVASSLRRRNGSLWRPSLPVGSSTYWPRKGTSSGSTSRLPPCLSSSSQMTWTRTDRLGVLPHPREGAPAYGLAPQDG